MGNNNIDFCSAIEGVDIYALFEHIRPALAEAINKVVGIIDVEPSILALNEEAGCLFYNDKGIDNRQHIYMQMNVVIDTKPKLDVDVVANAFGISISVPFTMLYSRNPSLTKSFGEFMKEQVKSESYIAEFQKYNGLIEDYRKRFTEDEFQS